MLLLSTLVLSSLLGLSSCSGSGINCRGCTPLDALTFDKMTSTFPFTLVKFDAAYPYGDKHDSFAKVAAEAAKLQDVLVGEVGIKDYGEKDNQQLAERSVASGKKCFSCDYQLNCVILYLYCLDSVLLRRTIPTSFCSKRKPILKERRRLRRFTLTAATSPQRPSGSSSGRTRDTDWLSRGAWRSSTDWQISMETKAKM